MQMIWNPQTLKYEVFHDGEQVASESTLPEAAKKMDAINKETFKEAYRAYITFNKEMNAEKENSEK